MDTSALFTGESIRAGAATNPKTAKTVFTNYKELTSEISDDPHQENGGLDFKKQSLYLFISTNNGIIFKNGIGSTTLTAYAYDNGVDVTGKLEIRWSKDGTEFYVGKSVTVNATDVDTKAVYSLRLLEMGIKRGYYEVTITKNHDGEPGTCGTTRATWRTRDSRKARDSTENNAVHPYRLRKQCGWDEGLSMSDSNREYIGMYVDFELLDSTDPS